MINETRLSIASTNSMDESYKIEDSEKINFLDPKLLFLKVLCEEGLSQKEPTGCQKSLATHMIIIFLQKVFWSSLFNLDQCPREQALIQKVQIQTLQLLISYQFALHIIQNLKQSARNLEPEQQMSALREAILQKSLREKNWFAIPMGWKSDSQAPGHNIFAFGILRNPFSLQLFDTSPMYESEGIKPTSIQWKYSDKETMESKITELLTFQLPSRNIEEETEDLQSMFYKTLEKTPHFIPPQEKLKSSSPLGYFCPKKYTGGCAFNFLKPLIYQLFKEASTNFSTEKQWELKRICRFIYFSFKRFSLESLKNAIDQNDYIQLDSLVTETFNKFLRKYPNLPIQADYLSALVNSASD